jgi:chemotaxis protein MotB
MVKKKIQEPKKDNSERWLLTYADLITLLMIFFVVMYAISNVDAKKYEELSQSLGGALNPTSLEIGVTEAESAQMSCLKC